MANGYEKGPPGELAIELEAWRNHVVDLFMANGETNRKLVEAGVTWGSLWIEECKSRLEREFPEGAPRDELRKVLLQSMDSAAHEHPWLPRYPSGAPSIRATMIAKETFLLAQGDDADYAKELLEEAHSQENPL